MARAFLKAQAAFFGSYRNALKIEPVSSLLACYSIHVWLGIHWLWKSLVHIKVCCEFVCSRGSWMKETYKAFVSVKGRHESTPLPVLNHMPGPSWLFSSHWRFPGQLIVTISSIFQMRTPRFQGREWFANSSKAHDFVLCLTAPCLSKGFLILEIHFLMALVYIIMV